MMTGWRPRPSWRLVGAIVAVALVPHPSPAEGPVPPDAFGNVIPDFSRAGYRGGGVALPAAAVVEPLRPDAAGGDDTARIQAAIDRVATRPARAADGLRGAVLLRRGAYRCGATLRVPPGVTLRGEGPDPGGTTILATMVPREGEEPTLIRVAGTGRLTAEGPPHAIRDAAVPIGATTLRVDDAGAFRPGDLVRVERAASAAWIRDIKMDQIRLNPGGSQWAPEDYELRWAARVARVEGDAVTLDTPVPCAIEGRYGGGALRKAADTRQSGAAVEGLRLECVFRPGSADDERHAWDAITVDRVVDSWVRDVTAVHFANACVRVEQGAARVTVQDCAMLDPVSKLTGGRRYSFGASGSQVLIQRCYARGGRHDFVTGSRDLGPTVFLDCLAEDTHGDSGPHHRWSCGQLYDNVRAGQLNVRDRGGSGSGHGWAGNAQVFWNCEADSMICERAWIPSAQSWAVGCVAARGRSSLPGRPDGLLVSPGRPVAPRSLYLAQLAARVDREGGDGAAAVAAVTTPEQREGRIWGRLRDRHRDAAR
jgi:hypothetical protein